MLESPVIDLAHIGFISIPRVSDREFMWPIVLNVRGPYGPRVLRPARSGVTP